MSTIKLIGKSTLGELGLCQSPAIMKDSFCSQFDKIAEQLPNDHRIIMTSMSNYDTIQATGGRYLPKIRIYDTWLHQIFDPKSIYDHCVSGLDDFRPAVDFILNVPAGKGQVVLTTFSREAPILAFESEAGAMCLGTILRKSLIAYGDYLFKKLKDTVTATTVTLVACNHYPYPEGSIPDLVKALAQKYDMHYKEGVDSEKDEECYHRGEKGNHVVAMW